ncbi:MAG: hypothetical protein IJ038_05140 [Clostridia bacterium]|nr:hypothetical protein [Clostridia bacterium]
MKARNDYRPIDENYRILPRYADIKADRTPRASESFKITRDPKGYIRERLKLKVYREGSSFIGIIPREGVKGISRKHIKNPMYLAFRKCYVEAMKEGVPKRRLSEHLFEKMLNNEEESYLLEKEDIKLLIKKEANRIHQKKKRYYRKLAWLRPNYFLTFTYSDGVTDAESFEHKLRRCLSNLADRRGWRYIGAKEHGSENGRVHFHFLVYIPEGEMIGELFKDYHWNHQKRRREYFTNNTYFHERFGDSQFEAISGSELVSGRLSGYLVKYIIKEDVPLIYSRHLATEVEMEVIKDEDVFMTFYDHTRKVYLALELFFSDKELKRLCTDEFLSVDSEGMGYNVNVAYKAPAYTYDKKLKNSA